MKEEIIANAIIVAKTSPQEQDQCFANKAGELLKFNEFQEAFRNLQKINTDNIPDERFREQFIEFISLYEEENND